MIKGIFTLALAGFVALHPVAGRRSLAVVVIAAGEEK